MTNAVWAILWLALLGLVLVLGAQVFASVFKQAAKAV